MSDHYLNLTDRRYTDLLETRASAPEQLFERAAARARRPLLGNDGRLLIIAVDHPARRINRVGDDPWAMSNRRRLLDNTMRALRRPGVDGLLASPDILEDLMLLGELDDKVVFGSMNRAGLSGSAWELDDRMTGHDAAMVEHLGLDGAKMLLRILYDDPLTVNTIEACAKAVSDLAARQLIAMVEPLPAIREGGRVKVVEDIDLLVEAVGVASALGNTSAYTWLKLPAPEDAERMLAATTLPALLLGGDPGDKAEALMSSFRRSMEIPNVRGLVAGRSLVYPADGNVERWVDMAVEIVHG